MRLALPLAALFAGGLIVSLIEGVPARLPGGACGG
jgi:hypothetical protein